MSLEYEPSTEPLHISAKQLFFAIPPTLAEFAMPPTMAEIGLERVWDLSRAGSLARSASSSVLLSILSDTTICEP
jgi:hypothetical protein